MKLVLKHHGLFKHYAKVYMQEIMEEKLPIIYTLSVDYDPFVNENYTETFSRTEEGENKGNATSSSNSKSSNNASGLNVSSDTPQGQLNKQEILNGKYASTTNASETESNINDETEALSETTTNAKNKEEYTRHVEGNRGISSSYQVLIQQYRENIIAIDREIIKELNNKLFMGLY